MYSNVGTWVSKGILLAAIYKKKTYLGQMSHQQGNGNRARKGRVVKDRKIVKPK